MALKFNNALFDTLKSGAETWQKYWNNNNTRYREFMRFVFKSAQTASQIQALNSIQQPTIEFNSIETELSRTITEFMSQEPSPFIQSAPGIEVASLTPEYLQTLDLLNSHIKAIFCDNQKSGNTYQILREVLGGGYSVLNVYTDYASPMSMEQNIYLGHPFDVTLCGFDPMARHPDKGDGRWCFELIPITEEQYEKEYEGKYNLKFKPRSSLSNFSWTYRNSDEKIVMIGDFYIKEKNEVKIFKLTDGRVVTQEQYEDFLKKWDEKGILAQPPQPTGVSRKTILTQIRRVRMCEGGILKNEATIYSHLPSIFIDGNSAQIQDGDASYQMTRPFCFQAQGVQRLQNYVGQSLAKEVENMIQHKLIAAIESVPEDYMEAYTNFQKSQVVLYKHLLDPNNLNSVLPPPREVVRPPFPTELLATFEMCQRFSQAVLGAAQQGDQLQHASFSGIALALSGLLNGQSSAPYLMGYIHGINKAAEMVVDLISKLYLGPRSIPVMNKDGIRENIIINQPNSPNLSYDPYALQVSVSTSTSFAMQKQITLETLVKLMGSADIFAQFMNEEGLPEILDNLDIRGIDNLKAKSGPWMQNRKMMQQAAQQQASQQQQIQQQLNLAEAQKKLHSPTSEEVKMAAIQADIQNNAQVNSIKQQQVDDEFIKISAQLQQDDLDKQIKLREIDAENSRTAVEMALKTSEHLRNS